MKELEKNLKALANRRRLAILKWLKVHKEAPVGEIAQEIHLSFRSTSKHLTVLLACEIVIKDQRGLQMFYSLAIAQKPEVKHVISIL